MISHPRNTEQIVEAIQHVRPRKVLDVGCGFGKWGLLTREALAAMDAEDGDLTPDLSRVVVDAVENANYFRGVPWLQAIYDDVQFDDVLRWPSWRFDGYDLVLLIDVLEHWPLEVGATFLERCARDKVTVLVSTPVAVVMYEPEFYGADCPKHVSQWTPAMLAGVDYSTDVSLIRLL